MLTDPQIMDGLLEKIEHLVKQIEATTTKNAWFGSLLKDILNATIRELRHLRLSFETSTPMASWVCRNTLELTIIAKYVLLNKQNADNFTKAQQREARRNL